MYHINKKVNLPTVRKYIMRAVNIFLAKCKESGNAFSFTSRRQLSKPSGTWDIRCQCLYKWEKNANMITYQPSSGVKILVAMPLIVFLFYNSYKLHHISNYINFNKLQQIYD